METEVRFSEQPEILDLIAVLQNNGLEQEQQKVMDMARYLESIGSQYGEVLNELKAVRGQLSALQDKGIAAAALRVVDKVENRITEMKEQVITAKNNFTQSAARAVSSFKEHGMTALKKALVIMEIPQILAGLKGNLHKAVETMQQGAITLVAISRELHTAGEHTKNAGRVLSGKMPLETAVENPDKGILNRFHKMLSRAGAAFEGLEQRVGIALDKLKDKKPSVRVSLRAVQPQKKSRSVPVKRLEQTR